MKTNDSFSLSKFIASCFFLGYTPLAPGTITSIVAMFTLFFLPNLSLFIHFIFLNILFFVGAIVSEKITIQTRIKDAPFIVIDEWFGMWLALFLAPHNIWIYILALVIFRIFDIVKPRPILYIENNTPGGLGVMLDDACAGIFTFAIIQMIVLFL